MIDDLDDGFSTEESEDRGMFRFAGRGDDDEDLDRGLPVAQQGLRSTKWSRMTYPDAFGKYRRTMAVVRGGTGQRSAIFRAELPHAGEWELEYYFPGWTGRGGRRSSRTPGTWKLVIGDSSGTRDVEFDADAGERGWNSLGRFEMAIGEVTVRISDETDGDYVQADAVRWKPISGGTEDTIAALTERNP